MVNTLSALAVAKWLERASDGAKGMMTLAMNGKRYSLTPLSVTTSRIHEVIVTTISENGKVLTETVEGTTQPADYTFSTVNDFVHSIETTYEDLEALCLGMAAQNDRIKQLLLDIKAFDVSEYLLLPVDIRKRIQSELDA